MKDGKPLAYDLYCGLGGWADGLLAEGWHVVGFDIEAHDYGTGGYPGELVLRDATTIHGSEFADADLIVCSPPCQEYSYMVMPWSLAKAKAAAIEADTTGEEIKRLNLLFDTCFRIQREASEAAGPHIPMIVENVRGAQKWVGRAAWHYGSFYLWGDVPALMPIVGRREVMKSGVTHRSDGTTNFHGQKVPGFRFDGSGKSFQTASVERTRCTCPTECDCQNSDPPDGGAALISEECPVHNWNERPSLTCPVHGEPVASGTKTVGHANIRDGHRHTRHLTNQRESDSVKVGGIDFNGYGTPGYKAVAFNSTAAQRYREGVKFSQSDDAWFDGKPRDKMLGKKGPAVYGSKSNSRKAASAMIAKIPHALARWVAKCYYPSHETTPVCSRRETSPLDAYQGNQE